MGLFSWLTRREPRPGGAVNIERLSVGPVIPDARRQTPDHLVGAGEAVDSGAPESGHLEGEAILDRAFFEFVDIARR